MYLGIDLAWRASSASQAANESGVVALRGGGQIADAGWTVRLAQTLAWIERVATADTLLLIDAPLVVNNEWGQRTAEKQVGQRYGRWHVSANSTNRHSPRLAGVTLREELEQRGWRYDDGRDGPPKRGRTVCECYPYVTLVGAHELGYEEERPR